MTSVDRAERTFQEGKDYVREKKRQHLRNKLKARKIEEKVSRHNL